MSFGISRMVECYVTELATALPATARGSADGLATYLLGLGLRAAGWTGLLPDLGHAHADAALDVWGPALDSVGTGGSRQASAAALVAQQLQVLLGREPVADAGSGNSELHAAVYP